MVLLNCIYSVVGPRSLVPGMLYQELLTELFSVQQCAIPSVFAKGVSKLITKETHEPPYCWGGLF